MKKLILKAGREKSLLRRHPWIFSGAIHRLEGAPQSGDVVRVVAQDGRFLAHAGFSAASQIAARVWSFNESEAITPAFFEKRFLSAAVLRTPLSARTHAWRLVHAESDGLPGVIVDRYGDIAVLQLLTAGAEPWRDTITSILMQVLKMRTVYERSDADVRALEGLPVKNGLIAGEPLPGPIIIDESGLKIEVDIAGGHKTGYYLDQRENRLLVRELAQGAEALNCFCYSGGMSVAALQGGAKNVLSIDSSGPALQLVQRNVALNGLDAGKSEVWEADVFAALRTLRDKGRSFDLIILDPPKFAPTAQHAEKAARAYKDINLLGCKLLRPHGHLMTFSCSGGISADLFQKIVAGAALDAGTDLRIVGRLGPGRDHPVALNFPEGDYLKGLLLQRGAVDYT